MFSASEDCYIVSSSCLGFMGKWDEKAMNFLQVTKKVLVVVWGVK